MEYFRETQNTIDISGKVILPIDIFLLLEPEHNKIPEGYDYRLYIPGVSNIIVGKDKISIQETTDWYDGNRYLTRIQDFKVLKNNQDFLTDKNNKEINELVNSVSDYKIQRLNEYPHINELIITLWEYIVENKDKISELQEKRLKIKNKYPKR